MVVPRGGSAILLRHYLGDVPYQGSIRMVIMSSGDRGRRRLGTIINKFSRIRLVLARKNNTNRTHGRKLGCVQKG